MRYFANWILSVLPPTRFFKLKRLVLSFCNMQVGEGTRICGGVKFYGRGRIEIGKDVWIGLNCKFYTSAQSGVVIGDNCDIGPEVEFMNGSHELGGAERRAGNGVSRPISIGSGSWIGTRSVLLGGAEFGPGVLLGACSLALARVYAENTLYAGQPIKKLREFE